jgi:energy-coupling factor transporter ATP-binding protein EcfA2
MTAMTNKRMQLCNILTALPFTKKGMDALQNLGVTMSPELFFKELYVEPNKYIRQHTLPEEDMDFDAEDYEGKTPYEILKQELYDVAKFKQLNREKENFETLFYRLDEAIYCIIGTAGCGKTTYYNHLEHEIKREHGVDLNTFSCDLEDSIEAFSFLAVPCNFKNRNNVWTFIGYILKKIAHPLLWDELDGLEKKDVPIRSFLEDMTNIYFTDLHKPASRDSIDDNFDQMLIFKELRSYLDKEMSRQDFQETFGEYVIGVVKQLNEKKTDAPDQVLISEELRTYLDKKEMSPQDFQETFEKFKQLNEKKLTEDRKREENEKAAVAFVMGFVIRLFYCLSKLHTQAGSGAKKYICAIDSVEHYIYNKKPQRLQNVEISTIVNGIDAAARIMRSHINRMKKNEGQDYNRFYGIVIMMRDTSETFITPDHNAENGPDAGRASVYISEWFDAQSIVKKRRDYFAGMIEELMKDEEFSTLITALDNIMGDTSPLRWGMHGLITRMYNHNQRGIQECLVEALDVKNKKQLDWFNQIWNIVKTKPDHATIDKIKVLKYMCRQYIFRIMLDYVDTNDCFDRIMAATKTYAATNEVTSYARRIATTLHNWKLRNDNEKKFMSFPYLIKAVLVTDQNMSPRKKEFKCLGEILYAMNDPDEANRSKYWSPLVEIKFDPKPGTTKKLLPTPSVLNGRG